MDLSLLCFIANCDGCQALGRGRLLTWLCYRLDQFLTIANSTWILSEFSIFDWIRPEFILLVLMDVELLLCLAVNSFLECYGVFSAVKLSVRSSFVICPVIDETRT